jgi:HEAT repeat protein
VEKTARALIKLLQSEDPNLRLAAMRVVSALEMRNKSVIAALGANLETEQESLQIQALHALAQLGPADAVDLVAPMLSEPGAVRQHAARVMALAGSTAVPVLRRQYARADHHGRRAIASTLAEIGGRPAFDFLLRSMPAEDLDLMKHLTACARAVLARLPAASRLTAVRGLRTFLKDRKTQKNPHAVIAGLVLLGGVADPKAAAEARKMLLGYLDKRQPEPVRRNAAISMSRLPVTPKQADALLPKLVPLLAEREWSPVPQNILPLLQRLDLSVNAIPKLVPLLRKSPHTAVQIQVLSRLHGCDKAAVVREVIPFIAADHPRMREAAEAALKSMPSAIEPLFDTLVRPEDDDVGRRAQWILRAYSEPVRRRYARRAADQALKLHEKGDVRARVFVDFVCGVEPTLLQTRVASRLKTLKRSSARGRWERIAALLRVLADRNLLTPDQRYDYGVALLHRSRKDVRREARASDPSLQVLSGIARQDGAKLVRSLLKERSLGADEYFYLGFHLTEGSDEMRAHGQELLKSLLSRYPRHKLRKAAKQKMELPERHGATVEA